MELDRFLVCGLGSLGQHCVLALKDFGVNVVAIDRVQPEIWEVPNLVASLDELIIGDCRQNSTLEDARIERCRVALLVTNSEQVNAETALAIRHLNPDIRLVVRSAKTNLNQLLSRQLGNFIAYEPTDLPAQSFALAALGTDTIGFFNIGGFWLRVIQKRIDNDNPWSYTRTLHGLENRNRRILSHSRPPHNLPQAFHQWESEETLHPGDTLIYIETADRFSLHTVPPIEVSSRRPGLTEGLDAVRILYKRLKKQVTKFWKTRFQQQVQRILAIYGLVILSLLLINTLLYKFYFPGIDNTTAFFASVVLLLGGYGDLFGGNLLQPGWNDSLPTWMRFFSLTLTIVGTSLVGILYGFLTQMLLSRRFHLLKRRPAVPLADHIAIVGLGRVGQRVAAFLQQLNQPLVGISFDSDIDKAILPDLPLIVVGELSSALGQANLSSAKSVVVVTDDEMFNLEVALMVQAANPKTHLVIRTAGQRLSQHLMAALPSTQAIGMHEVAAQVFAGVAFGESIVNLYSFNHQTILVTEYEIRTGDTLDGLLLAEVAYGYGVVPIFHHRLPSAAKLMPSDDIVLSNGDLLFVLATIDGLQQVEIGKRQPRGWQVRVEKAMTEESVFEGGNIIVRMAGCPLNMARDLMNNLPGILNFPLYKHQGQRLVRALEKVRVNAEIVPIVHSNDRSKKSI